MRMKRRLSSRKGSWIPQVFRGKSPRQVTNGGGPIWSTSFQFRDAGHSFSNRVVEGKGGAAKTSSNRGFPSRDPSWVKMASVTIPDSRKGFFTKSGKIWTKGENHAGINIHGRLGWGVAKK